MTVSTNNTSIYTLSKELGISTATVSRALKNHPAISAAVRKKVQAAARKCNYRPKFVRTRITNLCVLIQQYDEHPLDFGSFISRVLEGVAEYCRQEELEMSLFSAHVRELNQYDIVRELRRRNADGAVVLRATSQSRYLPQMDAQEFPYFCLLANDGNASEKLLSIDEEKLAHEAVSHLVELGHRRIGALVTSPMTTAGQLRLKGYRRALKEHKIEPIESLVFTADAKIHCGGLPFGVLGIDALLSREPNLTAVFTTCEESARGAIFRLNERGIAVPDRMSVVGFDDFPGTAYTWPPLTTVRIPYLAIGYEGARQVHRLTRGLPVLIDDEVKRKTAGELVIRGTTGRIADC